MGTLILHMFVLGAMHLTARLAATKAIPFLVLKIFKGM